MKSVTFSSAAALLLSLSATTTTVSAECSVYMHQSGPNTRSWVNHYTLKSFKHDDGSCASYKHKTTLVEGEWVSVKADKNHQSTIQNLIQANLDADNDGATEDDKFNFYTCDGITQGSQCDDNNAYKATCWKHYIWYPETKKVCVAELDDNGDYLYNDDGEPYGLCESCHWQDNTWGRQRGLPRGGQQDLKNIAYNETNNDP